MCSCKAPIQQLATVVQSRGGRRTQAHTGLQHSGDSRLPGKSQNSSSNRPEQLPGRQPGRGQGQLLCAAPQMGPEPWRPGAVATTQHSGGRSGRGRLCAKTVTTKHGPNQSSGLSQPPALKQKHLQMQAL